MGAIAKRLEELGLILPEVAIPVANYVPAVMHGGLVHVSGQIPRRDGAIVTGQVGRDLSIDDGYEAARLCALYVLAAVSAACGGDLDRVQRCLQVSGFVNAGPDFTDHPKVINGASDLIAAVLGEAGRHARAAVGCSSLPLGAAVEVGAVFAVR